MSDAGAASKAGRSPGSFLSIEREIVVDAPPERVFGLVSDLGRSPEWAGSGEVRAMRREDAGPVGPGSRWRSDQLVRGMGYHTTSTVIRYEPGRWFIWKVEPPAGGRSRWGFHLEPAGNGTRLTHFYDLDDAGNTPGRLVLRLMMRVLGRRAELGRHLSATLQNLKRLAEGSVADRPNAEVPV